MTIEIEVGGLDHGEVVVQVDLDHRLVVVLGTVAVVASAAACQCQGIVAVVSTTALVRIRKRSHRTMAAKVIQRQEVLIGHVLM